MAAFDVDSFLATPSQDTTSTVSGGFDVDAFIAKPDKKEEQEIQKKEELKKDPNILKQIDSVFRNSPIVQGLAEFQGGVNASVVDMIDFFTMDQINSIMEIAGSDKRVPTLREATADMPEVQGGFMPEGVERNIMRGAGQVAPAALAVGGAIRQGASMLPRAAQGEGAVTGTVREIARGTTAAQDVGYGMAGGAGGEFTRQYGSDDPDAIIGKNEAALIGQIFTPLAMGGVVTAGRKAMDMGKDGINHLVTNLTKLSDDAAADMLADSMVRSGMTADEVAKKLVQLGDEGTLADVHPGFTRLLKAAVNKIPRLEGKANTQMNARQASRDVRIKKALESSTGTGALTSKQEIKNLDDTVGKEAGKLYEEARKGTFKLSDKLQGMIDNPETSLGKARVAAQQRIVDEAELTGKPITQIDIIDGTKRELDTQINKALRDGDKATVRTLTMFKKKMLKEADDTIPTYKQARETFGGKKELENAADMGRDYLKLKRSVMEDYFEGLSPEERRMFSLGAKDAILDKLDDVQVNSDAIKQISGKGGDIEKLKMLFGGDNKAYKEFKDALDRETAFILTRRGIQGQSSTNKQIIDSNAFEKAQGFVEDLLNPATYARWIGKTLAKLSKDKSSATYKEAQEQVGDILLEANMKPEQVINILNRGNRSEIKNNLDKSLRRIKNKRAAKVTTIAPRATAVSSQANDDFYDKYRESQGGYMEDK